MNASVSTQTAERTLEALSDVLNLEAGTLELLGQADPRYFRDARENLLKALSNWEDDQKVPACLHCGSPRVDWIEATASYRCQECDAIEERAGQGRKAIASEWRALTSFAVDEQQTNGVKS